LTVDPYDPEAFRRNGHAVIDLLADYLDGTANRVGQSLTTSLRRSSSNIGLPPLPPNRQTVFRT